MQQNSVSCAREFSPDDNLDIIEWDGAYHEIKVSVPGHKFETQMKDYTPGR
jgi:hypothetical protein